MSIYQTYLMFDGPLLNSGDELPDLGGKLLWLLHVDIDLNR